jgi:hypothetical protein
MTYHEMAEQFREIVEAMEQRLEQPRTQPGGRDLGETSPRGLQEPAVAGGRWGQR